MGKTRLEELFEELYASSKQHDSWQRYAMIVELRNMMKQPKGRGSDQLERSLNDEELFETEVATEPIETKHGTVKREANAEVISAIVKKEQMPQIQVPSSKLEHGLQIHNASPIVCEGSQYVVGCDELCEHQKTIIQVSQVKARDELLMNSKNVTNNQDAHHLFDKMPLRVQSRRGHIKCHKTWRFKFKQGKQQRGKLRSAHQLIHRGNVMYKSLCSSAKVALMKKNKFSITWPMLKDDCFIEDDQVSHETPPLWLLIRSKFRKSKFRKFKFRNKNFQKMMREHGHFSHLKLKSDMGEDDEMFTVAKAVSKRSMIGITFGIRESNAGEDQRAVCEQSLRQISLVLQQVMRSKKIKFPKQWMFKYKYGKESIQRLQIQLRYKSWLELEERFKIWSRGESWRKQKEIQQFTMETKEEMEDMMEEDQKQQQGDSEPLVTVPDLDAKLSGGVSMDKKQFHLSLRTNRVWDPGG